MVFVSLSLLPGSGCGRGGGHGQGAHGGIGQRGARKTGAARAGDTLSLNRLESEIPPTRLGWLRIPFSQFVKCVGASGRLLTGNVPVRDTAGKRTPLRSRARKRNADAISNANGRLQNGFRNPDKYMETRSDALPVSQRNGSESVRMESRAVSWSPNMSHRHPEGLPIWERVRWGILPTQAPSPARGSPPTRLHLVA